MNARRSGVLAVIALCVCVPSAVAQTPTPSTAPPAGAKIEIVTLDGYAVPSLHRGERFVVLGSRFSATARAAITFRQKTDAGLGTFDLDASGGLRAEVVLPAAAATGKATIVVSDGVHSAQAAIVVAAGAAIAGGSTPDRRSAPAAESAKSVWPWAALLALVLTALVWRRTRRSGESVGQREPTTTSPDPDETGDASPPDPDQPDAGAERRSRTVNKLRGDVEAWTKKKS